MIAVRERERYALPGNKLSFSSMQLFHDCPECWYLRYVERLPERKHIALPRGGAVHAGLQYARERVLGGHTITTQDAVDHAVATFEGEIATTDRALLDLGDYASTDGARDDVALLTGQAVETFLPQDVAVGIWAVEARVDFGDIFPFAVEAYADSILTDLTIQDTKTGSKAGEPDEWNRLQLRIYGIPFALAGQKPKARVQRVWPRNDRLRGRVAEAHFWEWDWSPWQYDKARQWVLQTAGMISDAMASGEFPARPSFKCKWPHFEEVA